MKHLAFTTALVMSLAMSSTAMAKPHHHRHYRHHHHHRRWLWRLHIHAGTQAPQQWGWFSGTDYVNRALAEVGSWRYSGRDVCARFVNSMLGRLGSGSAMANSFERWGHPAQIERGAVVVSVSRWGLHAGIVVGVVAKGPQIVSASHGRAVRVSTYSYREIVAARMP